MNPRCGSGAVLFAQLHGLAIVLAGLIVCFLNTLSMFGVGILPIRSTTQSYLDGTLTTGGSLNPAFLNAKAISCPASHVAALLQRIVIPQGSNGIPGISKLSTTVTPIQRESLFHFGPACKRTSWKSWAYSFASPSKGIVPTTAFPPDGESFSAFIRASDCFFERCRCRSCASSFVRSMRSSSASLRNWAASFSLAAARSFALAARSSASPAAIFASFSRMSLNVCSWPSDRFCNASKTPSPTTPTPMSSQPQKAMSFATRSNLWACLSEGRVNQIKRRGHNSCRISGPSMITPIATANADMSTHQKNSWLARCNASLMPLSIASITPEGGDTQIPSEADEDGEATAWTIIWLKGLTVLGISCGIATGVWVLLSIAWGNSCHNRNRRPVCPSPQSSQTKRNRTANESS